MNVWLVQTGEPLPLDERVRKMRTALLAEKLLERGHDVLWWVSGFDHFRKKWITRQSGKLTLPNGIALNAISGIGYKRNISLSRVVDHRLIARKFAKMALRESMPDIIIASTPPHDLAYQAAKFAHKLNIPLVVDIRDTWPDLFIGIFGSRLEASFRCLLRQEFRMTRDTMRIGTALIGATEKFLQWGLDYAGREAGVLDKVFYLGYQKRKGIRRTQPIEKFADLSDILSKKFLVFFVGTLSPSYHNPSILLDAAELLKNDQGIHFVIAGDGELHAQLKERAGHLKNASVVGWVNQDEMEYLLRHSSVGACPSTKSVDLPTNKAFAYGAAGLPIISSFGGELKNLIEKYRIGFFYEPNDVRSLVKCISRLRDDFELYNQMSGNAENVFSRFFDADKIYHDYAEHIERVFSE